MTFKTFTKVHTVCAWFYRASKLARVSVKSAHFPERALDNCDNIGFSITSKMILYAIHMIIFLMVNKLYQKWHWCIISTMVTSNNGDIKWHQRVDNCLKRVIILTVSPFVWSRLDITQQLNVHSTSRAQFHRAAKHTNLLSMTFIPW